MAREIRCGLVALLLLLAPAARAATIYVANDGTDTATCGSKSSPCRSITRGIGVASSGDRVVVGPGSYRGESGAPGCDCFVAVDKSLTLTSSDGAAATAIDARGFQVDTNVRITADHTQLGSPGKGFTVTNPKASAGAGITIGANDVTIEGNQVVADASVATPGIGIMVPDGSAGPVLVQGNQVLLWNTGIFAHALNGTVRKNQVSLDSTGIDLAATSLAIGNVASDDGEGMALAESASAIGNGVYGSATFGIFAVGLLGQISANNLFGNQGGSGNCGIGNNGSPALAATDNYWGAPTGPGPDPADQADQSCNANATTVTSPFSSTPFHVKAPVKP